MTSRNCTRRTAAVRDRWSASASADGWALFTRKTVLNDTPHSTGCCCCGGNELENAIDINVNILAYALTH